MDTVEEYCNRTQQLIADQHAEQALELTRSALERWPMNLQLRHLHSEALEKTGQPEAAILFLTAMLETQPSLFWTAIRLVRICLRVGKWKDAVRVYSAYIWNDITPDQYKSSVLNELYYRIPTLDAKKNFLENLAGYDSNSLVTFRLASVFAQLGDNQSALNLLDRNTSKEDLGDAALLKADLLFDANRTDEALQLIKHWVQLQPDDNRYLLKLCDLLLATNRIDEALSIFEPWFQQQPTDPLLYRKYLAILNRLGDYSKSKDILLFCLKKWPKDWIYIFQANRIPLNEMDLSDFFETLRSNYQSGCFDDWCKFQYAISCLRASKIKDAISVLSVLVDSPTVATRAKPLFDALTHFEPEFWSENSRLNTGSDRDVHIVRVPNAVATMLVFASWDNLVSFLPHAYVDSLLKPFPVNLIYLNDNQSQAFLKGVESLGNTETATIARLHEIIIELGSKNVITMGASGGGFAAVRYGALLKANLAISFSGPTYLDRLVKETRTSLSNPWYVVNKIWEKEEDLQKDLLPIIRSHPKTKVLHFYGQHALTDKENAERIAQEPQVTVNPVAGVSDHWVMLHLIAQGKLPRILDENIL